MIAPTDTTTLHWNTIDATLKHSESDSNHEDCGAESHMENGPLIDFNRALDNASSPLHPSSGHSSFSHVSGSARPAEGAFPTTSSAIDPSNLFFAHSLSRENNIRPLGEGAGATDPASYEQRTRDQSGSWDALSNHNDFFRPGHQPVVPHYDRLAAPDAEMEADDEEQPASAQQGLAVSDSHTSHIPQNAKSHPFSASTPQSSFITDTGKLHSDEMAAAEHSDNHNGPTHQRVPNRYAEQTASAYHTSTSSLSLPRQVPAKPSMSHMSADDVVASSALRDWEQRHEDALEEARKEEIRYRKRLQEEAQRQLEEWYQEIARKREARHQANIAEESRQKDVHPFSSSSPSGEGEGLPESEEMSWTCVRNLLLQTSSGSRLPFASSQNDSHSRGGTRSESHTRKGSPCGHLGTPLLTSSTTASTSSSSSVFDKRKAGGEDGGGAASSSWGVGDKDTLRMRHILDTLAETERAARG